jgi:chemotaxis protein histidine kinase CheA
LKEGRSFKRRSGVQSRAHSMVISSLLPAFIEEATRLVERAAHAFAVVGRAWEAGAADDSALGQAKSALHTLRGNASMIGHRGIHAVVVELERVLARAEDPRWCAPASVDILATGAALLRRLLREALDPPPEDGAVEAFASRVRQHLAAERPR